MTKITRFKWQPHTALPKFEKPTTLLLAYPPEDAEDISFLAGIYVAGADGRLVGESTNEAPDTPFFWVTEDALLEGLPC